MKKILLLTDGFPYGRSEPFLFPEIAVLKKHFDISIVTIDTTSQISPDYQDSFPLFRINANIELIDLFKFGLPILFKRLLWQDLYQIVIKRKLMLKRAIYSFAVLLKAEKFAHEVRKIHALENYDLIYSYWHDYKVLALGPLLAKLGTRNTPVVARTHGYDLYHERRSIGQRQPYLPYMDKYLSTLFFVSKMGYKYYQGTFGFVDNCVYDVAYLGVATTGHTTSIDKQYGLSLLSVANTIPLKRVELIIQALETITEFTVKWVHFGAGESLLGLKHLAKNTLNSNPLINYTFYGHVPNSEVIEYYRHNCIDVFISTSASEGGCPVTMQEAFAFGVPVVATNVGGVNEIVEDGINGFLLEDTPTIHDIRHVLARVAAIKEENQLQSFKTRAKKTWQQKFNADTNFKQLATKFHALIEDNT